MQRSLYGNCVRIRFIWCWDAGLWSNVGEGGVDLWSRQVSMDPAGRYCTARQPRAPPTTHHPPSTAHRPPPTAHRPPSTVLRPPPRPDSQQYFFGQSRGQGSKNLFPCSMVQRPALRYVGYGRGGVDCAVVVPGTRGARSVVRSAGIPQVCFLKSSVSFFSSSHWRAPNHGIALLLCQRTMQAGVGGGCDGDAAAVVVIGRCLAFAEAWHRMHDRRPTRTELLAFPQRQS